MKWLVLWGDRMGIFSLEKLQSIIFHILSDKRLKQNLYLSGGLAFFLATKEKSDRMHEDIDFILNIKDMSYVRSYLKENKLYQKELDSLYFENGRYGDYGLKVIIDNVPVSFSPFIIKEGDIYQRIINTKLNLKEARMYHILMTDYVDKIIMDDDYININTIEFMKAIKEIPNREKDKYDISLIEQYGYDKEKYQRIKSVLNEMDEVKHKISFIGLNHLFIQDRLRISITNSCNMSCFYCHNEGQGHCKHNEFMDINYIDKLVDFIINNNIYIKKVNVTGGEPLLHPNLIEIIEKLSKITKDIKLNTNGTLLTKDKIIQLKKAGLTAMNVGIDSFWSKQSKPNLIESNKNIDNLKQIILFAKDYFTLSINTVITYYNYDKIEDMIRFSINHGLYKIKLIELIDFDFWQNKLTNNKNSNYFKIVLDKYRNIAKEVKYYKDRGRYDVFLNDGFLIRFGEDYCKTHACGNLYSIINANGEYVCCQKSGDSKYIDFDNSYENIKSIIDDCHRVICNNKIGNYPRDFNGKLIEME